MKYIKKISTVKVDPIKGSVSDTLNVEDKITNAPSLRLAEEMTKDVYSTEEKMIGTWLDGKPIYMIGVTGTLPSGTTSYALIPNSTNVKKLIYSIGLIDNTEVGKSGLYSNLANTVTRLWHYNGGIGIDYPSYLAEKKYEIVLYYTKTTD